VRVPADFNSMERHPWRRRRRTLNEELLSRGLHEAQAGNPEDDRERPPARRLAELVFLPLLFTLAGLLVHQVSWSAGLLVGVLGILIGWWRSDAANRGLDLPRTGPFRAFVLVGLAVVVAATVLVGVAGFSQEDVFFLAVMWAAWLALWALDHLLARLVR
jgi:hypothetical protein